MHPREQTSLWGHEKGLAALRKAFTNRTMPGVWLLVGPQGIGKATLAYIFAREVLQSSSAIAPDIIGRQIGLGVYPNLFALETAAKEGGGVDQVRNLLEYLHQASPFPGWRVVIIDGVESLNLHAANALLKILEEPPKDTLFMLIAHSLARVLPTIRSRSVRLSLAVHDPSLPLGLSQGFIERWQQDEEFYTAAGKALSLTTQGDFRGVVEYIDTIAPLEAKTELALELLWQWVYRLIIYGSCTQKLRLLSAQEEQLLRKLLEQWPIERWVKAFKGLNLFLLKARDGAHLDRKHLLLGFFCAIERK